MIRTRQAREGSIVICDHQTNGKGQRGNIWVTKPNVNLTFSLVLRPDFMDISEQFFLNMTLSNSIRKLLQEYLPTLKLKWPNDLIVPGFGKIGGILIENTFSGEGWEHAVVGIGINVNQMDFEYDTATSLRKITGTEFDLEELFRLLITQLEQGYLQLKKGNWNAIRSEYLQNLYLKGEWSKFEVKNLIIEGKITGVTASGKLEIEVRSGDIEVFDLKEVRFLELG